MRICVYGAASPQIDEKYTKEVYELCKRLGQRGHELVFGAGNFGVMGAAARGFHEGGGKIIGIAPKYFIEENIEPLYVESDELVYTETLAERKSIMEDMADAFIVGPGGIGTFDELFQAMTARQLKLMNKPIALFNVKGYYDLVHQMLVQAAELHFLRENWTDIYHPFTENEMDQLIAYVEAAPVADGRKVSEINY